MLLPWTVSLIKRPAQRCKLSEAPLRCWQALNKALERSEDHFHWPHGLGFIASVVAIPRIKMKYPTSALPLRFVSSRTERFERKKNAIGQQRTTCPEING